MINMKSILSLVVLMATSQMAFAGVVDGIAGSVRKAIGFEEMVNVTAKSFKDIYADVGMANQTELYLVSKSFGPVSNYELDSFKIAMVKTSSSRDGNTMQLNVYVQDAAEAKADKLKLLVERAMKNVKWNETATAPFRKGSRLGVGVGPEALALNDGAQNVKIMKFIEEMAALGERLKTEDLLSVLAH
jgi:hypothetical protein